MRSPSLAANPYYYASRSPAIGCFLLSGFIRTRDRIRPEHAYS